MFQTELLVAFAKQAVAKKASEAIWPERGGVGYHLGNACQLVFLDQVELSAQIPGITRPPSPDAIAALKPGDCVDVMVTLYITRGRPDLNKTDVVPEMLRMILRDTPNPRRKCFYGETCNDLKDRRFEIDAQSHYLFDACHIAAVHKRHSREVKP